MAQPLLVTHLSWERVLLHIDIEAVGADPNEFYLTPNNRPYKVLYPVSAEKTGDDQYRLTINITQFNGRRQVPNGTYHVVNGPVPNEYIGRESEFESELEPEYDVAGDIAYYPLERILELDDASRSFLYNNNRSSYAVNFAVSDNEDAPGFIIRTYAFARGGAKPSGFRARTSSKLKKRWTKLKRKTLKRVYKAGQSFRKDDGNRILFASEARPNMQGNLKAVHDRMVERGLKEQFEFDYSFRTQHSATRQNALALAWKVGRANTVLIDDYFAILMDIGDRKSQRIIQLWHAGSGFKSVGFSRFGNYGSPKFNNAHRKYTYAICGSQHLRDVYSEVFGMERESIISTGLPRIDYFLEEGRADNVSKVFDSDYPAAVGKRKILFAPTFRGRGAGDAHYDYSQFDFDKLYEAMGNDSVFLFRQHHFIVDPAPIPDEYTDRLIDVSAFPDSNDLLLISDLLVTDYSSIVYEYSLLERPIVLFAYDLELYSATRGMHKDYRVAAPGPVAENFDQFLALINDRHLDAGATEEYMHENFDFADTHNSDRVIDNLILGTPTPEGSIEQTWQTSQ
ncbi:CDP-glycerol glycerophosphotransferase family protein [Brevibacterium sp. JSBI002]|uniref:CDP-glycerol glycerophosphotransferase family protein n=1 Tax=Brevibacterium sp. JSBI002 TaxID=2886045 RepID=UPI00222F3B89|nr:CDP-glycerol glycerophosphotransferase family protein [Brevibacterium sp. JSBI002]UZD61598.1 CDP-glycerol glycerophosphotransferase family protein [Brevibacterium sp. JSBI002]